jgi:hypothetical protein
MVIVNICCEERDDDLHANLTLENFGVVMTNIERRKSGEERLSLYMLTDTIQNVGEQSALPYPNDVDPFPEFRSTLDFSG